MYSSLKIQNNLCFFSLSPFSWDFYFVSLEIKSVNNLLLLDELKSW